ncbi:hypothetical protein L210DRAFT_3558662 [Boletus edulis BED1]|uniref:Uncharacterized protein n=1 Tax=Boletus edulis BED1 TaxID=1328754 RepID=A0AAD4G9C1_BOLED|nr:hypothetical protein L210DRAFT_3558662 [Boletus edulis BED1]
MGTRKKRGSQAGMLKPRALYPLDRSVSRDPTDAGMGTQAASRALEKCANIRGIFKAERQRKERLQITVIRRDKPREPRCIDIRVDGDQIASLVFCVDGKHIAGGCIDGSIRRWRVSDWGETEPTMKSDGTVVKSLVASSDGKWMAGPAGR